MKKLIIGLTLLISMSSFARSYFTDAKTQSALDPRQEVIDVIKCIDYDISSACLIKKNGCNDYLAMSDVILTAYAADDTEEADNEPLSRILDVINSKLLSSTNTCLSH
jgi:hypothetical protein